MGTQIQPANSFDPPILTWAGQYLSLAEHRKHVSVA